MEPLQLIDGVSPSRHVDVGGILFGFIRRLGRGVGSRTRVSKLPHNEMLTWFEWLKMMDQFKLSDGELKFLSAWKSHGIVASSSYPVGSAIVGGLPSCLILLSWAREAVFLARASLTTGDDGYRVSGGNDGRRIMSQP